MSNDTNAEITAMSKISDAVKDLNEEAIKRVIGWAASHYGLPVTPAGERKGTQLGATAAETGDSATEFAGVWDLYNAADPKTGAERALVVGYWFQKVKQETDFDGFSVNSELKNLGHQVANITVAFTTLMDRKPRLAMQVKKSGRSKQSKKRYKLTTEGIREVERMLRGVVDQEDE